MPRKVSPDYALFTIVLALLALGIVMVYSASAILAMDRFQRALETEMDVKRAHLELLVRIKNVLSPEQQEQLRALRDHGPADGPPE